MENVHDMCQCENMPHVGVNAEEAALLGIPEQGVTGHAYLAVPAGERRAAYIGRVCDECAATCMKDFIMD